MDLGRKCVLGALALSLNLPALHAAETTAVKLMPLDQAAQSVRVPDGFNVTLFAGEPDVLQPIAMTFDSRGRLWVAECHTYADRHLNFDLDQRDRIVIFEDTDNDGRFDLRTVFWDQAQRLTSIEIGFGGVWALCAPNLIFIPDRDGDDRPDGPPEILLDGWDHGPVRHNIVNGLKWGPDGWLYGRHGIQATSFVGAPGAVDAERTALNCAIWRYHPQRRAFEVVSQGTTNPWGSDWDEHGQLFFVNVVIGHLWHSLPGAWYRRMYGEPLRPRLYQLIDQHADHYHWDTGNSLAESRTVAGLTDELGGGHAHCGMMIYQGDNWPAEYRGSVFTLNLHGRRANHDRLERHGNGYTAKHAPDLIRFDDPWFRGTELGYGPDGGVYVLDWSDTGECHEDDDDGVHRETGRIYKITYGAAQRPAMGDLANLSGPELVKLLEHPNEWFARQARRILHERAAANADLREVHTALRKLFAEATEPKLKLRALWSLYVSGGASEPWLQEQLRHPNEHVRVWALQLLTDFWPISGPQAGNPDAPAPDGWRKLIPDFVRMAESDSSGLVRLYLASTLQRLPLSERLPLARALLARSEDASDHNQPLLLWYGIEPLVGARPEAALQLAAASRMPLPRQFIARCLTEQIEQTPGAVNQLLEWAQTSPELALDVLRGMSEALRGWRKAPQPTAWESLAQRMGRHANEELRQRVRELSVVFGDGRALEELRQIALDATAEGDARRRALQQLIEARPDDLLPLLKRLVKDRLTVGVAVRGLGQFDDSEIPKLVIGSFRFLAGEDRAAGIALLCSRAHYAEALLNAVAAGRIARDLVTAFHARQIQSLGQDALNRRLAQVWGELRQSDAEKQADMAKYRALLTPERLHQADLSRGRELYNLLCLSCHKLFGEGGEIGPDLTGSGRMNLEYLLENIVDPSALVAADFRLSVIELKDGQTLNGVLGPQTERTVTIQTPTERLTVERNEISSIQESALSLMPDGLLEAMDEAQIRDLIAYLMSPRQVPMPDERAGER